MVDWIRISQELILKTTGAVNMSKSKIVLPVFLVLLSLGSSSLDAWLGKICGQLNKECQELIRIRDELSAADFQEQFQSVAGSELGSRFRGEPPPGTKSQFSTTASTAERIGRSKQNIEIVLGDIKNHLLKSGGSTHQPLGPLLPRLGDQRERIDAQLENLAQALENLGEKKFAANLRRLKTPSTPPAVSPPSSGTFADDRTPSAATAVSTTKPARTSHDGAKRRTASSARTEPKTAPRKTKHHSTRHTRPESWSEWFSERCGVQ
jgi:hypothetical protein